MKANQKDRFLCSENLAKAGCVCAANDLGENGEGDCVGHDQQCFFPHKVQMENTVSVG